jgi:heptosyltransferase-2
MNIKAIKFIDKWVGKPLCYILGRFVRKETDQVAFIQLFGVGETILTLPAIKRYKESNPGKKITIICTGRNKAVYEGLDFIDKIIILPFTVPSIMWFMLSKIEYYDEVYDFEEYLNVSALVSTFISRRTIGFDHGDRNQLFSRTVYLDDTKHFVYNFCDLVGVPYPGRLVPIKIKKVSLPKKKIIGLFPGTAESAQWRMWPLERFIELGRKLKDRGYYPVFVLGPHEVYDERLSEFAIFKGDLHELAYFCSQCRYFVSADTGPMHVAACVGGVKTIGLFGPNLPDRFFPFGKGNINIYHKLPCSPCIDNKTGFMGDQCTDNKCMKSIEVKEVLRHIK